MDPIVNPTISMPNIPALRKDEKKERKGAAIPFLGGRAASSGLWGIGRAGSSGFLGTGRITAFLSRFFGSSSWLGGLFASSIGPSLVLGGYLAVAVALVGLGLSAVGHWGAQPQPGNANLRPELDGVGNAGLKVRGPSGRSLDYLNKANKGQIAFDEANRRQEKEKSQKTGEETGQSQPGGEDAGIQDAMSAMAGAAGAGAAGGGRFGQLTGNTGSFGAGSRAGLGGVNGAGKLKTLSNQFGQAHKFQSGLSRGKLGPMFNKRPVLSAGKKGFGKGKTGNAFGQLKLSKTMSTQGANTKGDEASRTYSADAFDQGKTTGGEMTGLPQIGSGIVTPVNESVNPAPNLGSGYNVTPYQPLLNQAAGLSNRASSNKSASVWMILGALLTIAAAYALMSNHTTFAAGVALLVAGLAALAAGYALQSKAQQQAAQAAQIGQQIQQQYGQTDQGQVVIDCAQAAANGATPEACAKNNASSQNITDTMDQTHANVDAAVDKEIKDSAYTIDGGNGEAITP